MAAAIAANVSIYDTSVIYPPYRSLNLVVLNQLRVAADSLRKVVVGDPVVPDLW